MRFKSSDQRNYILSVFFVILGSIFIHLVNNITEHRPGEHWAYLVGLFLIIFGTYIFITLEKIQITTNTPKQRLLVRRQNLFHQKTESIPYSNILSVHTVRIGRRAGLKTYHLVIRLDPGGKLATGRWSSNPAEIDDIAHELAQEIGCEVLTTPVYSFPIIKTDLMAFTCAVFLYVIGYRFAVGQVSLAMLHGNAPAIFIPIFFITFLYLFRTRQQ